MKLLLAIFLAVLAIVLGLDAAISNDRIETDAAKWTELYQDFLDRTPYPVIRGRSRAKCRMMRSCCPTQRSQFFDLARNGKFSKVCTSSRSMKNAGSSSQCDSYIKQHETILHSDEYKRYDTAMKSVKGSLEYFKNWWTQMSRVCSKDELESYYCDIDNLDLFRSCQEKVLRSVARENNGKDYDTFIRDMKNYHNTYKQKLSHVFRYCS